VTLWTGCWLVVLKYGATSGALDPISKVPAGITTIAGIGVTHGTGTGGVMVSSSAFERLDDLGASGSRYHDCANTLSPATQGLPRAVGFAAWNASQSTR
jgi:hypothetical protein